MAIAGLLVDRPVGWNIDEGDLGRIPNVKAIGASDGVYIRYHVGILALVSYQYLTLSSTYLQLINVGGDGGVAGGGLCTMRSLLGEVYFLYIGCTGHGGRMIRMWTAVVVLQ